MIYFIIYFFLFCFLIIQSLMALWCLSSYIYGFQPSSLLHACFLVNLSFKSQLLEISLTFIAPESNLVWVHFSMHRKANLLTLGYGKGKCSIYGGAKQGERVTNAQNVPQQFQGRGSKGSVRERGAGCGIMQNYLIGCYQGEVLSIISLLSPTSKFLQTEVFIWWGSVSCKNNIGMCVRPPIYIFQRIRSLVILLLILYL